MCFGVLNGWEEIDYMIFNVFCDKRFGEVFYFRVFNKIVESGRFIEFRVFFYFELIWDFLGVRRKRHRNRRFYRSAQMLIVVCLFI